jgi:hypothetical protein
VTFMMNQYVERDGEENPFLQAAGGSLGNWHERVPGYGFWWDMATAHVSEMPAVNEARQHYEAEKKNQRYLI